MNLSLEDIRECLDGDGPAIIATCAADGRPNVSYLSQVEYIDAQHLALSFQFFNKTRCNVLANHRAALLVMHPHTGFSYRITIEYLRTESDGPLFERMKAKLSGVASHTGMSDIFVLRGADVYRVLAIESLPDQDNRRSVRISLLPQMRLLSEHIAACGDLEALLETVLSDLQTHFKLSHLMLLVNDASASKLYTVATRGYATSGVGSEVSHGAGVIGVCAQMRTPIRIGHMTSEVRYSRAVRDSVVRHGHGQRPHMEIPLPGLSNSQSQMAVPIYSRRRLFCVLYTESEQALAFSYDLEDALVSLASTAGASIALLSETAETEAAQTRAPPARAARGRTLIVNHYRENDSIFLDGEYLIKGVAGAMLWAMLSDYVQHQRELFSNRELRMDRRLKLPEFSENLEARLILLTRRLADRRAAIQIQRVGRGRVQLRVSRPLELHAADEHEPMGLS